MSTVVADEAATTPDDDDMVVEEATHDPAPPRPSRKGPPRIVWLATVLFGLVACLWSVAVPAYRAPDEAAHLDLTLYLAEGNGYPRYDERFFGKEIGLGTDRYLLAAAVPWPKFDADDAPPRSDRADVDDLGGTAPDKGARRYDRTGAGAPYVYNQMPQHPPLYYLATSSLLKLERWLLPGDAIPSLDRELGLLRLANVLLVLPLPLLAWATVRRLGIGDARVAVVAALLPLALPQLTHIGGAINNDNLLTVLGATLAWLLAGVSRGERTTRTDVGVGVVLGLALLTKAFAVMFVPWIVAAYALGAWTTSRWRDAIRAGAVAGVIGAGLGGWWWVVNWLRHDQVAPTTETLTRTVEDRPEDFVARPVEFLWTFSGWLIDHTWAWIGHGTPKFELPTRAVVVLSSAALVAVLVAVRSARPGLATDRGLRRWDVVLAWLPVLLMTVFVAKRAWGLYETNGKFAFIQGRYLFGVLLGLVTLVAFGATRVLGRWAVGTTLAIAAALQVWVLNDVVEGSWSGPGMFGPVRGALAWSPWPSALVLAVAGTATLVTGWIAVEARRL